ncbi:helix-hairpin-helix domain-containing protein [Gordonia crocea]|nr:helix-hairpin-helix domain-containing protein [Gordonia crocea]
MRTNRFAWGCTLGLALGQILAFALLAFAPARDDPRYNADSVAQQLSGMTAVLLTFFLWFVAITLGFVLNQTYLRWRASTIPWYEDAVLEANAAPPPTPAPANANANANAYPPAPANGYPPNLPASAHLPRPLLGPADASQYWAGPPVTQAPVDINTCTGPHLAASARIAASTADVVVAEREASGRYRSFDDLVARTRLMPHLIANLRWMSYDDPPPTNTPPIQPAPPAPPATPPPPTTGRGRRIDY